MILSFIVVNLQLIKGFENAFIEKTRGF